MARFKRKYLRATYEQLKITYRDMIRLMLLKLI